MSRVIATAMTIIGGRDHCEDFSIGIIDGASTFLAVFDGHCGKEAAKFACHNLWDNIKSSEEFGNEPNKMVRAIKSGFIKTQEGLCTALGKPPYLLCTLHVACEVIVNSTPTGIGTLTSGP